MGKHHYTRVVLDGVVHHRSGGAMDDYIRTDLAYLWPSMQLVPRATSDPYRYAGDRYRLNPAPNRTLGIEDHAISRGRHLILAVMVTTSKNRQNRRIDGVFALEYTDGTLTGACLIRCLRENLDPLIIDHAYLAPQYFYPVIDRCDPWMGTCQVIERERLARDPNLYLTMLWPLQDP